MSNKDKVVNHPTRYKDEPFDIESKVRISVRPEGEGAFLVTDGMRALGKPELCMHVPKALYAATACRMMNDTARHIVERNKDPQTGQRVQLATWTIVEYKVLPDGQVELIDVPGTLSREVQHED